MTIFSQLRQRGAARYLASIAAGALIGLSTLSASAQQPVTLNFWDMIWGPPEYIDAAKGLVDQFNTEHPEIKVEYRSVPWNNWYQTFVTAIGAGTAPDVSTGAGYQAVQLYDLGAIRPVDDLVEEMKASGDLDDFLPGTVDTLRYDDHYVALPWGLDIRVWFYRKDLLEAAGIAVPTNWQELRDAAKALTKDGKYGVVASGDTGGSHYIYNAILNNGGGLFTADRKLDLKSERNVEALQYLAGMAADGSVSPASVGYNSDDRRGAFTRGEAAFMLDGPGAIDQAGDQAANIGIVPPLAGPHGDKGTIFWVNNIMVYQQTQHPEEVKTFLKWWSKNQKELWTKGRSGQLPTRASIAADPYFTGSPSRSYVLENYVPTGKTTATQAEGIFPALNEVEGEGVMQTLVQEIWQGKDLGASLDTAEQRLRGILGE
ncbi:ABC transporter substrate-binding protein [Prosthecomicrobium pneumaticum]|uniref:Multiple sugar transport system substrate-binding protein n=1 Tax=Prosthecomicrobium pneumaticum TaxID=81895 RepID=A0A7W9FM68_9HYPH|nr:sugar ABC transporter substrate-binding protein [Prosthecomicrobium pneumaticum]MBB5753146.1 multiple sugar transport system substrate-binding protein [Prosthecomicrobium pneumaticum]